MRLAIDPCPRTTCGNFWQLSGRASYTVHSLPLRNTQPVAFVRLRTRPSSST